MQTVQMNGRARRKTNKGATRRLRREGSVPAVVYGLDKEPRAIVLNEHELELTLRGALRSNVIFSVTDDEGVVDQTIIREIQRHPVTERLMHVDFLRIDLEKEVHVSMPIHVVGESPVVATDPTPVPFAAVSATLKVWPAVMVGATSVRFTVTVSVVVLVPSPTCTVRL